MRSCQERSWQIYYHSLRYFTIYILRQHVWSFCLFFLDRDRSRHWSTLPLGPGHTLPLRAFHAIPQQQLKMQFSVSSGHLKSMVVWHHFGALRVLIDLPPQAQDKSGCRPIAKCIMYIRVTIIRNNTHQYTYVENFRMMWEDTLDWFRKFDQPQREKRKFSP